MISPPPPPTNLEQMQEKRKVLKAWVLLEASQEDL